MGDLKIVVRKLDGSTLVITPPGSLDNSNAHEMVEILDQANREGFGNIILDLSKLSFISSAGVGSILGTVEMFRETGGDIYLCEPEASVLHVLEVLDLTDYLTVKKNQEEALTACKAGVTK